MNKKAASEMWWMVAGIVLAMLFLGFGSYLLAKTKDITESVLSPETLKIKDGKCKFDGDTALNRGIRFSDIDDDGRPDSCDICTSYTNPTLSKNDEDRDLDWMPAYCDKDDNDKTITACKSGFTFTKDKRCVEGKAS